MASYIYPAILAEEKEGGYSVAFPDIDGCFTSGTNLSNALEMAADALCLMLYDLEESGAAIPVPTKIRTIRTEENQIATLISCDTLDYRKRFDGRAVKKTLTVPNWLNTLAEREGVSFSQVLQDGLKDRLGLR